MLAQILAGLATAGIGYAADAPRRAQAKKSDYVSAVLASQNAEDKKAQAEAQQKLNAIQAQIDAAKREKTITTVIYTLAGLTALTVIGIIIVKKSQS